MVILPFLAHFSHILRKGSGYSFWFTVLMHKSHQWTVWMKIMWKHTETCSVPAHAFFLLVRCLPEICALISQEVRYQSWKSNTTNKCLRWEENLRNSETTTESFLEALIRSGSKILRGLRHLGQLFLLLHNVLALWTLMFDTLSWCFLHLWSALRLEFWFVKNIHKHFFGLYR